MERRNSGYDMRPNSSDTWGGMDDTDKKKEASPPEKPAKRSIDEHPLIKAARERALAKEKGSGVHRLPVPESPKAQEAKKETFSDQAVKDAIERVPETVLTRFLTTLAEDRGRTTGTAADVFAACASKYGADKISKMGSRRFGEVLISMTGKRKEIMGMLNFLSKKTP